MSIYEVKFKISPIEDNVQLTREKLYKRIWEQVTELGFKYSALSKDSDFQVYKERMSVAAKRLENFNQYNTELLLFKADKKQLTSELKDCLYILKSVLKNNREAVDKAAKESGYNLFNYEKSKPNKKKIFTGFLAVFLVLGLITGLNYKKFIPFGVMWDIVPVSENRAIFHYEYNRFNKVTARIGLFDLNKRKMLWNREIPVIVRDKRSIYSDGENVFLRYYIDQSEYESVQFVRVYNIESGKILWDKECIPYLHNPEYKTLGVMNPRISAFSDNNTLYQYFSEGTTDDSDYRLFALDKISGEIKWSLDFEIEHNDFSQTDSYIILNDDRNAIIINKKTGKEVFSTNSVDNRGHVFVKGVLDGHRYYYERSTNIYYYDLLKEKNVLLKETEDLYFFPETFGVYEDSIIILQSYRFFGLIAISRETGKILWMEEIPKISEKMRYDRYSESSFIKQMNLTTESVNKLPIIFGDWETKKKILYEADLKNRQITLKKTLDNSHFKHLHSLFFKNGKHFLLNGYPNGIIGHILDGEVTMVKTIGWGLRGFKPGHIKDGKIWSFPSSITPFPTKNWMVIDEESLDLIDCGREEYREKYYKNNDFIEI